MRRITTLAVIALTVALLGCSSWDFKTDYAPSANFAEYRTFAWHPKGGNLPDNPRYNTSLLHQRIRVAIGTTLEGKGFTLVMDPEQADVLVNYHAAVDSKMSLQTMNSYYGYPYYGGYPYYRSWGGGSSTTYVNEWDEGTLVVDMFQNNAGAEDLLVWRGAASGAVGDKQRTPEQAQSDLNGLLANMFSGYPPK